MLNSPANVGRRSTPYLAPAQGKGETPLCPSVPRRDSWDFHMMSGLVFWWRSLETESFVSLFILCSPLFGCGWSFFGCVLLFCACLWFGRCVQLTQGSFAWFWNFGTSLGDTRPALAECEASKKTLFLKQQCLDHWNRPGTAFWCSAQLDFHSCGTVT